MEQQVIKDLLGERLFLLIYDIYSDYAVQITGMLLEFDNQEILSLLDSADALKQKVV